MHLAILIPALNEEQALPLVLTDLEKTLGAMGEEAQVVVIDNGSTDQTAAVAQREGADVVSCPERGYGAACLTGIARLRPEIDTVVFLDGDHSDFVEDLPSLLTALSQGSDLVIGARKPIESGALQPQQRFGNALACTLIRLLYGMHYHDLGPFRAIRRLALARLQMRDRAFGWTVEMQTKAARLGLRVTEVPVRYRARVGVSKISGTFMGSLRAGRAILWGVLRYAWGPLR